MKPKGIYTSPTQFVQFAQEPQRLSDHIATRDRSPDFTALGLYLPNPDPILKKQGKDISVYKDLRSDAHVGGCIRRRKAAVQAMEWRVEREGASARSAKLAQSVLDGLDMRRLLSETMDAVLYGWQPLEVIWSSPGTGAIAPQEVVAKPANWFHFDAQAQLRFKSRQHPFDGEELAPRKFLVPAQEASYANPYGFADLSMCFWPTVFKRGGLKFWVTFSEKFGTDWVVGKVPRSTGKPEQNALLDQLEAMVQDAVAVIPDDASVEIVGVGNKSASADLYERLLMFCRSEVSIALLGQNQSTEASSTHASATAGLEVTQDLRDGDARLCEATINQLLRWVVDLNDGESAPAPKFELFEQAQVDEVQAKRDKLLTESGVRFTPAYWQRVYNLEDGDLEQTPATPATPVSIAPTAATTAADTSATAVATAKAKAGATAAFAEAGAAPEPDEIDALVNAELAQWQPLLSPMVDPLQHAIDQAVAAGETAEQLIARLPALLVQMNADALAQALTRAAFTARLGAAAGLDAPAAPQGTSPAFAEAVPAPTPGAAEQLAAGISALGAAISTLASKEPVVVNNYIQPTPVQVDQPAVQVDVHVPAQAAPSVLVTNQVQPAAVAVNAFPVRAEQTVERDANDEVVKTVTTYQ